MAADCGGGGVAILISKKVQAQEIPLAARYQPLSSLGVEIVAVDLLAPISID